MLCNSYDFITEEDNKATNVALKNYATTAVNALDTLNSKIDALDEKGQYLLTVQVIILKFMDPSKHVDSCLIQRAPAADSVKALNSTATHDV